MSDDTQTIGAEKVVSIDYKLLDDSGTVIDEAEAERITARLHAEGAMDYLTYCWGSHSDTLYRHLPDNHGPRMPYVETIHRLGNLTLLPHSENASLSNGSWDRKRLIYKILSAETADELDPLLNQAKAQGIEIGMGTAELLATSKYLPMTRGISSVDGAWTLDLVDKRSTRIAELAWSRIAPWLGL